MKYLRPRPIQEDKLRRGAKTTDQDLNPEANRPRVAALLWGQTSLGSSKLGCRRLRLPSGQAGHWGVENSVMNVEAQASIM